MNILAVCLVLLFLGGCASITTGTSQSIGIATIPEGAECLIYSNGVQMARITQTPGKVSVGKAATDLVVTCKKDDYLTNSGAIDSKYQTMTWGNVIFGGLIGVAIDAGTGSIYEYDTQINIRMIPVSFLSNAEKDAFFDQMEMELIEQSDLVQKRIREFCKSKSSCENQLIATGYDTKRKRLEIESARLRSRVAATQ